MMKLYKRVDGQLHYHEAFVEDGELVEHWGIVGETGDKRATPAARLRTERSQVAKVLAAPLAAGFEPIDLDDHAVLLIEFAVDGFGTDADLAKRHALQDRMDETLGWAGLGHCDGGSIGSGTMEVCCYVVDFPIARRVIAADLADTEFADYTRIFDEGAD